MDFNFGMTGQLGNYDLGMLAVWARPTTGSRRGLTNATWLGCDPRIEVGVREVTVDVNGIVQSSFPLKGAAIDQEQGYATSSSNSPLCNSELRGRAIE